MSFAVSKLDNDYILMKSGILYLVATPIGNYADITQRALEVLENADAVICEEFREARTLLKKIGIAGKTLLQLNEHSDAETVEEIIKKLINGKNLALISDAGTPSFADPGTLLVRRCNEMNIPVKAVPGPSSLMAAISLSPLPLDAFFFEGFLPRKAPEREDRLKFLKKLNTSIILMDTPYRLSKLLEEVRKTFGAKKLITLAVDVTMENEALFHGTVQDVIKEVGKRKGEFILIIHQIDGTHSYS